MQKVQSVLLILYLENCVIAQKGRLLDLGSLIPSALKHQCHVKIHNIILSKTGVET